MYFFTLTHVLFLQNRSHLVGASEVDLGYKINIVWMHDTQNCYCSLVKEAHLHVHTEHTLPARYSLSKLELSKAHIPCTLPEFTCHSSSWCTADQLMTWWPISMLNLSMRSHIMHKWLAWEGVVDNRDRSSSRFVVLMTQMKYLEA